MRRVQVKMTPGEWLNVTEPEYLDLTRQGLILTEEDGQRVSIADGTADPDGEGGTHTTVKRRVSPDSGDSGK